MAPKEKTSDRASAGLPSSCSGEHEVQRAEDAPLHRQRGVPRRRQRPGGLGLVLLREAEVEQPDPGLGEHDVARLQVAVHDALPVRGVEGLGDLQRDGQGLGDRHGPALELTRQAPCHKAGRGAWRPDSALAAPLPGGTMIQCSRRSRRAGTASCSAWPRAGRGPDPCRGSGTQFAWWNGTGGCWFAPEGAIASTGIRTSPEP